MGAFVFVVATAPAIGQEAAPPIAVRYLQTAASQPPLPPLVHLEIELENPADEPRWILVSLSRAIRLPRDGQFASEPEAGLPFFVLQAKEERGQASMVGFLGEPRFTAFYLPAKSKATIEDFGLPSLDDLSEFDWLEAKSLLVNNKTPVEKWLPASVESSKSARIGKDAVWVDALRDSATGEPLANLPKDQVSVVAADVARGGRIRLAGYTPPPRFFHASDTSDIAEVPPNWSLLAAFRPTRPLKVESLDFAPDGSWLAASLQTFKVVGLDVARGQERLFPMGEKTLARFFAFSPEGNLLVKQASEPTDEDNNLDLADWTASKVLDVLRFSSRITLGNIDHVPSPDGRKVAVAQRTSFNLWDFDKLETTARFVFPESANGYFYRSGTFSADGRRFAAGFESNLAGGKAIVWDVATGKLLAEFDNKQGGIQHLALSDDGTLLAGASKQSSVIHIWGVDTRAERAALRDLPFSTIHSLALSPDGKWLAVADVPFANGNLSRGIDLFDVAQQRHVGAFGGLRHPVTALSFSRDSRRLAAGNQSGEIRIWEQRINP